MQVEDIASWTGQEVVGPDDEKIGKLHEVYAEVGSTQPTIAAVKVGRLGGHHHLIPLADAVFSRGQVRVPYTRDQVASSPEVDGSGHLTRAEEVAFAEHHGLTLVPSEAPPEATRYESASARQARAEATAADLRRADELDAEAARLGDEADDLEARATELASTANADRERQRQLTAEASEIRRAVDAVPPP